MGKHLNIGLLLGSAILFGCSSGGGDKAGSGGDSVPPLAGTVADGLGNDIDMQDSTDTLSANWSGFSDGQGPIAYYQWAIGTTAGGTQVMGWTSVDTQTSATKTGLSLQNGTTYFCSVRAYDAANNVSPVATSDGVEVQTGGGGSGPALASSVSQWGITWTFDHEYTVGQFCNGDWWVLGPVSITDIAPHTQVVSGRTINGSMVNPDTTGMHGYDSTLYDIYPSATHHYEASLNVAIGVSAGSPLVLQNSSSLISCISQTTPGANSASQLKTAAVLTVLSTAPAIDAFRPPYTGSDKTVRHYESELDYGALAHLTPASNAPSLTNTAASFARVWLDHCTDWVSRYMHPVDNMPDYYREFTTLTGNAGLLLNCDYTNSQKRDLLVRFVQVGLDHYGNMVNGARWGVNGHCNGRKFPILFAGRVLGDQTIAAAGTTYATVFYGPGDSRNNKAPFSEDGQTFYVAETSPGVYNWGYGGYNASMVGMPEWGNFHTDNINGDNASWTANSYRLCCSANGWVGSCLTMRVMGLQTSWNQQAWFDYMDRYMQTEPVGSWTRAWDGWQAGMWDTYRTQF